jgi:uncharacterized membrane protein (DUF485 family)
MPPPPRLPAARRLVGPHPPSLSRVAAIPVVRGGTVWHVHPGRRRHPVVRSSGPRRQRVQAHWRVSLGIATSAASLYAGFILLVTFGKPLAARVIAPGLSVEVLAAVMIMTMAWLATGLYALWSNRIEAQTPASGGTGYRDEAG